MTSPGKLQAPFRVRNPAKITPFLHILARRKDGYHEVRLALVAVSLYDELTFRPGREERSVLTVESEEPLGDPAHNLVLRAAEAFGEAVGRPIGVAIHLAKHIPVGSGLGGGSGNAAATLVTLNRMLGAPLPPARLREIAARLGSDVPFFLEPRPSLAEGRGEILRGLERFPLLPVAIVAPRFPISSASAYRDAESDPREEPPPRIDSPEALVCALENDFERTLLPRYPELGEIKRRLLAAGAAGALLSGSGSAVFGLFLDRAARDHALAVVTRGSEWRAFPCEMLPGHDYAWETLGG